MLPEPGLPIAGGAQEFSWKYYWADHASQAESQVTGTSEDLGNPCGFSRRNFWDGIK